MEKRIHKLSDALSNQIAAGEVVERPGAALKELVENSLDAGATDIRINIAEGGVKLLEVIDNGHGIHPEDLPLALDRHATSKIREAQDLFAIHSWGFRGEALASIAAVSRLKISSRTKEFATSREILCEATVMSGSKELARPVGTTVRIEELFFNTPARKKFLKSQAAESSYCIQTLYRLALGSPHVSFELWLDGQQQWLFPAVKKYEDRLSQVFREGFQTNVPPEDWIFVENIKPDASVRAYLLPAGNHIPSTRGIFTFVNGRSVKDKLLQQAITVAAKEILFGHLYPQVVLFLETSPENVDVNVHPTKSEVRFRNPNQIFGLLRSTIERKLAELRPSIETPSFQPTITSSESFAYSAQTLFQQKSAPAECSNAVSAPPMEHAPEFAPRQRGPQVLGTVKNTYILCQDDQGLLLVDQHAAHERITYEKLKQQHFAHQQSSPLLIPLMLEVPSAGVALLETEFPRLEKLGLHLDRAGPSQVMVREIPSILLGKDNAPRIQLGQLVRDLCNHLIEEGSPENLSDLLLESVLYTLATQSCHGSVRAGQSLSSWEAENLLAQMSETDFSGHCPHGRPTSVRLAWSEIEKLFKRIV